MSGEAGSRKYEGGRRKRGRKRSYGQRWKKMIKGGGGSGEGAGQMEGGD